MNRRLAVVALFLLSGTRVLADEPFRRTEDVIYGRKHGTALTLDVFQPTGKSNGKGLIYVVSGGWFSSHEAIGLKYISPMVERGYTVFAVVHGSQPKFTIPEVLEDMNRSVRFIRTHAKEYGVDPDHLGIYGGSAGGHLSLMIGMAGAPGNPEAKDPVDRASSRVQAVAGFFPPTDFLNYGREGADAIGRGVLAGFKAPFDFEELDRSRNTFVPIVDEELRRSIGRKISPVTHVSPDDPPTLLFHGDADQLVPLQQSERIIARLMAVKVPAKLVIKQGEKHGWATMAEDLQVFADWFDEHLKSEPTAAGQ